MAESRVFMLNGVEPQTVVDRLENFLHNEKGMEVQSSPTAEGYVMQASQPENMWKTLTGMRLAITLQIVVTGEQMNVLIGEGQWTDKIGAGAIGLFVAWPLAITAGMGAFKQKKLPGEIFQVIQSCLLSKGATAPAGSAGSAAAAMKPCPGCGAMVAAGSKFCNQCGARLSSNCPACGAEIPAGSAFCPECGQKL